jgi:transcriptional regulator MraZ
VETTNSQPPDFNDSPCGMFNGRLDEKGRLKLPVAFQEFLTTFAGGRFFVTSIDRTTAQIYPISLWRENEKTLREYRADPKVSKTVLFNAQDLGADAEIDGQGRITFNPELRRALDMEGHGLRLYWNKGHVLVLTDAVYEARKRAAVAEAVAAVEKMEEAGLL